MPREIEFLGPLNVDLSPLGTGTSTLTGVLNPARHATNTFFCPVGGASTCTPPGGVPPLGSTCQRSPGCFGQPTCKRIEESGARPGCH